MPFTMYSASVPVFVRGLKNLAACLDKARANAEARKFAPEVLVEARLAPDMLKLSRQVQIASDTAKNAAARLESSFDELHARIDKTIAFLATVTQAQLEGSDVRQVTLKFPGREMIFTGADYLTTFALPNFYFHVTTAYAILRNQGVPLAKSDYLGGS